MCRAVVTSPPGPSPKGEGKEHNVTDTFLIQRTINLNKGTAISEMVFSPSPWGEGSGEVVI